MNVWGTEGSSEQPKGKSRPRPPARSRSEATTPRVDSPARNRRTSGKPEEVSEDVWSAAQYWIQHGEEVHGVRPPANVQEFAKRLQAAVLADKRFRDAEVLQILEKMTESFWKHRLASEPIDGVIQFRFLNEEWDEHYDFALTSIKVDRIKANPVVVSMDLVSKDQNPYLAVLDSQKIVRLLEWDENGDLRPIRKRGLVAPRKRNT